MAEAVTVEAEVPVETEVLVVGGGLVGLTAALLLRHHGVEVTLVEKRPATSAQPKARRFHLRSMEIFRELGLAGLVREAARDLAGHDHMAAGRTLAEARQLPLWSPPAAGPAGRQRAGGAGGGQPGAALPDRPGHAGAAAARRRRAGRGHRALRHRAARLRPGRRLARWSRAWTAAEAPAGPVPGRRRRRAQPGARGPGHHPVRARLHRRPDGQRLLPGRPGPRWSGAASSTCARSSTRTRPAAWPRWTGGSAGCS